MVHIPGTFPDKSHGLKPPAQRVGFDWAVVSAAQMARQQRHGPLSGHIPKAHRVTQILTADAAGGNPACRFGPAFSGSIHKVCWLSTLLVSVQEIENRPTRLPGKAGCLR